MKYTQPSFTTPVSNGRITDQQYQIAVGFLCPICKCKLTKNHKCPVKMPLKDAIDMVMGWKA